MTKVFYLYPCIKKKNYDREYRIIPNITSRYMRKKPSIILGSFPNVDTAAEYAINKELIIKDESAGGFMFTVKSIVKFI